TGTQTHGATALLSAAAGTTFVQSDPGSTSAYNLSVNVTPSAGTSTVHIAGGTTGVHLRDLRVNAVAAGGAGLLIIDAAPAGSVGVASTGFGAVGGSVGVFIGNGAGGTGLASRATVENLWRSAALEGYWAKQNGQVSAITRGLTLDVGVVTDV